MAVRVPVSLTPEEQAALVTQAKVQGVSMRFPLVAAFRAWRHYQTKSTTLAKTSGGRCNAFGCSDPSGIKIAR